MKKITAILMLAALFFSCKNQTAMTPTEVQEKLKQTMTAFLYNRINNDSSIVHYRILSVAYFANHTEYLCEFKVRMLERNLDTIGVMSANITKDFAKVYRKQ